jgi:predicted enzyme involved in methoxymalonyl-ACP biosynthesis
MDYPKPNEAPETSQEVRASALFVDLDLTVLDGIAVHMTDEELAEADLIDSTMKQIERAEMMGIPVVMVTRNARENVDRVFSIRPDLAGRFNEILCLTQKSELINGYMQNRRLDVKAALFIDDTQSELDDVQQNSEGVSAVETGKTDFIDLNRMKTIDLAA